MRGYYLKMGCLSLNVKYLISKPSGLFYFRRGIPQDLREFYAGKRELITSLKTTDQKDAISLCQKLAAHYDQEFKNLRTSGERQKAVTLLESYGLNASPVGEQEGADQLDNDGHGYNQFLEDLSLRHGMGSYSPPETHEQRALDILHGEEKITLDEIETDALKAVVVKAGRDIQRKKKEQEITRHFKHFKDRLPVGQLHLIRRKMVQKAVNEMLESGLKTGTVKKMLGTVRMNVKRTIIHHELNIPNPFENIEIYGLGLDSEKKKTFTLDQLVEVKAFIRNNFDRSTGLLLGLLVDTGTRCSEVGGMLLDDINITHKYPHMVYRPNAHRDLKTKGSLRVMPLVGLSLEAAKQIKSNTVIDQKFAFPQWNESGELKHTACNNAVNKLLQTQFEGFSTHCFRHTMVDRLKNANVRGELIKGICGWSGGEMIDHYGSTDQLEILSGALEQVLEFEKHK